MGNVSESSTADEDRADGVDEIMHGIDVGSGVGPFGHAARGGEETAEQHDADHEEPHHEDGLLHVVAIVGNDKAE